MGCLSSAPSEFKHTQADTDEKINILTKQYQNKPIVKYKLLLLGAAHSGKSTLLRQMRRLYGRDFSQSELQCSKAYLTINIIEMMRNLAQYVDILDAYTYVTPHFVSTYIRHHCIVPECIDTLCFLFCGYKELMPKNIAIRDRIAKMSHYAKFTKEHCYDFWDLWADPLIKQLYYQHIVTLRILDTFEYLFDRMYSYCRDDYIPTFEDLIHSYQETKYVNKIRFEIESDQSTEIYEIFDVPGSRYSRKKWISVFDNVSAIIFVAALSGYNQTLWEHSTANRMKEAIGLFRGLVNLDVFKYSHVILFLNKSDLFHKKIGLYSVKAHFKDYTGSDADSNDIIQFFKQKFRSQWKRKPNRKPNRKPPEIHFHITCATDTMCVKRMFESTLTIIVTSELNNQGFL